MIKITADHFKRRESIDGSIEHIEFLEHSYAGGGEYIERTMVKHPKETASNLEKRKQEAVYVNYCRQVIDLYNQYVFTERATRNVKSIDTERYMNDADYMHSTHEDMMRSISKMGSVKGLCGVIVDRPVADTRTKADEIAQGVHEYLSLYEPESIIDWEIKRVNGKPTLAMLILKEGEDLIKVWELDSWQLVKKVGKNTVKVIDKGINTLATIPFVMHRNRRKLDLEWFSGASDIDDIAEVNRMLFYYDCMAMEITSNTGFAMLTGSAEAITSQKSTGGNGGVENEVVDIGSQTFLPREQGDPEYKYVEPAHSSLKSILDLRNKAADEIRRLARVNVNGAQGVKSGDALEIEFQDLNAILSEKAAMLEATETRIFELIAKWQGIRSPEINISYPRKFGVREIGRDIDNAIKAFTIVNSDKFKKEKSKQIVGLMTKDSKVEDVDAIMDEIDTTQKATMDVLNGG